MGEWGSSQRARFKPAVIEKSRKLGYRIFGEYTEVCYLCGERIDITLQDGLPASAEIDHVISRKNGGPNEIQNLELAHKKCNNKKGALPVEAAKKLIREEKLTSRIW